MSDKSDVLSPIAPIALVEASTGIAPYVYFDNAPSFGFNGGVANITLEAFAYTAEGYPFAVGHLSKIGRRVMLRS